MPNGQLVFLPEIGIGAMPYKAWGDLMNARREGGGVLWGKGRFAWSGVDSYGAGRCDPRSDGGESVMDEREARSLVAQVLVLRGTPNWREEEDRLVASGAVLNSQVGGPDIAARCAALRQMAPGPMLLQCDMETGSGFAFDGTQIPPLMALGAAGSEELARAWGYAVGLEGRRLGIDVTWSPVLDVNTNPDNPIINVRSFGEDAGLVSRLGAALTRGMKESGLHPCAKHWPGHGDVAVDSHISLPTVNVTRERLEAVEWLPYRTARAAGLESVMTGHLLVPSLDPENCCTVSPAQISILRDDLGFPGPIFTDSLGMEGLRTTLDSTEAAWRALVAGHDQVLIDYKRPPSESVDAVVEAVRDGSVPEARLRAAASVVTALKARLRENVPLPPAEEIRSHLASVARAVAEASVTAVGALSERPDLGERPLLIVCDDLKRRGVGIAEEREGQELRGTHPLVRILREKAGFETLVFDEVPTPRDLEAVRASVAASTAVVGATFAHILCYKGEGTRLPGAQIELWREVAASGKLRAMMLFESPYALADLPAGVPVVVGYGADSFTLTAAAEALAGERRCPGRLPVTVASIGD